MLDLGTAWPAAEANLLAAQRISDRDVAVVVAIVVGAFTRSSAEAAPNPSPPQTRPPGSFSRRTRPGAARSVESGTDSDGYRSGARLKEATTARTTLAVKGITNAPQYVIGDQPKFTMVVTNIGLVACKA